MGDVEGEYLAVHLRRCLERWITVALPSSSREAVAAARLVTDLLRRAGAWSAVTDRATAADAAGDPEAAALLAWVSFEAGDEPGQLARLRRAGERGHAGAAGWLARWCRDTGRPGEAERWDERARQARRDRHAAERTAARRGEPAGMYRVAEQLLEQARRLPARDGRERVTVETEAHELLVSAARAGDADAAYRLGRLLHDSAEQAMPWYRRADELGHPEAAGWLGRLLYGRGDQRAGEQALLRAESRGDPTAASALAGRLRRRDPDRAEAAYRRAAAVGYLDHAWNDLALYLEERGDLAGAQAARRDAASAGEPEARSRLERFYRQHPERAPR